MMFKYTFHLVFPHCYAIAIMKNDQIYYRYKKKAVLNHSTLPFSACHSMIILASQTMEAS